MHFEHPVHYGNVTALDLEDYNVAHSHWLFSVVSEEEKISAVEGWLHAATEIIEIYTTLCK